MRLTLFLRHPDDREAPQFSFFRARPPALAR